LRLSAKNGKMVLRRRNEGFFQRVKLRERQCAKTGEAEMVDRRGLMSSMTTSLEGSEEWWWLVVG